MTTLPPDVPELPADMFYRIRRGEFGFNPVVEIRRYSRWSLFGRRLSYLVTDNSVRQQYDDDTAEVMIRRACKGAHYKLSEHLQLAATYTDVLRYEGDHHTERTD